MNPKERIKTSLEHRIPDRIPVDFAGTTVTGIHVTCVSTLRKHYGLEMRPVKVYEPYQMLGEIEEDLAECIGIDTIALPAPKTIFGFRNENWTEFRTPWGQDVLVSEHFKTVQDINGDLFIYPEGDTDAPPSGQMPSNGFFFDTIIRQEPIDDDNLNPEDNLEEFEPLTKEDLEYYKNEAERLKDSDKAVVGGIGGTAFGDIALVPAPFLKHPKGIREITEWYISTLKRQDYLHEVFQKQCEVALANLEKFHDIVGDILDVLFVCGTDFGTQRSSFCSTDMFDSLYKPYYMKINNWIHKNTTWKTFKHSCGAVENFMSHFIDAGFDIINPLQCSAVGMNPQHLKEKYGDRLVFWGGGIETQNTLSFGTPKQVREEVLKRCEIFSANGGFIFSSVHNVQPQTPKENLVAMIDAVREFNGRKFI